MTIKNFLKIISLAIFITLAVPTQTMASSAATTTVTMDAAKDAATLARITKRVSEIEAMDKTNLSAAEKSDLRKELKQMKKDAAPLDQKVYLSVGAIIIIILLLILILR